MSGIRIPIKMKMILAAEDIENFLFVSQQKKNSVHLIITFLIRSLSVCQVSTPPDVCSSLYGVS